MPARRPRPAGERDLGARASARTGISTLRPARRRPARRARAADRVREPRARAREAGARGRRGRALAPSRTASATCADALAGARRAATASSSSTARPRFGPLTVNALAAADRVIVPVQAEYYALEGLSQLLGSIDLVKARLNPRLGVAGILLTMVDGRTRLAARGRGGAAPALRRPRLHDRPCRARCASPRRRATACPRSPTTAARPARRPTGRWRWSLSSAPDSTQRRGLGRGLEVLIGGGAGEPELAAPARRRDPPEPAPAAAAVRARGDRRPRRLDPQPGRPAAGRRAAARARRLRADRRRAPLARGPRGGPRDAAGDRARGRRPRHAAPRARRERRAREPVAGRGGARATPSLVDEFELSLGEVAERVGRSKPSVSNRLRLLELPEEVLWMLARGELTEGHARAVLARAGRRRTPAARAADRRATG